MQGRTQGAQVTCPRCVTLEAERDALASARSVEKADLIAQRDRLLHAAEALLSRDDFWRQAVTGGASALPGEYDTLVEAVEEVRR